MIKEIKTHPRLSELEYASKIGDIISLLKKNAEVRVIVRFKGKELSHPELGVRLLSRFVEDLQDYATAHGRHWTRVGRCLYYLHRRL